MRITWTKKELPKAVIYLRREYVVTSQFLGCSIRKFQVSYFCVYVGLIGQLAIKYLTIVTPGSFNWHLEIQSKFKKQILNLELCTSNSLPECQCIMQGDVTRSDVIIKKEALIIKKEALKLFGFYPNNFLSRWERPWNNLNPFTCDSSKLWLF